MFAILILHAPILRCGDNIEIRLSRNIDSDFNLAIVLKIAKLTYTITDPFILQAWGFLHTVMKNPPIKIPPQHFLSKLPNIMLAYISAYIVLPTLPSTNMYMFEFAQTTTSYLIDLNAS